MAKKISTGKDVTSYNWVKIIQSFLLIVFGVVLCAFCYSTDIQSALSYITASIILVYGFLTIGFGMVFSKGTLSAENVSGCGLIALSILIYLNPQIVMDYIPTFAGVMLLSFGAIFLIEGLINNLRKDKNIKFAILNYILSVLFIGLGVATLVLTYSGNEENQAFIKMILIILVGVILIISGIFMIVYYALNPKFRVKTKMVVSKDGTKKYTIVEGHNIPVDEEETKKDKSKHISSKKSKTDKNKKSLDAIDVSTTSETNELVKTEN